MDLYLIAHKVRGEPAFDTATCEEVEGEEMWIIPTSGHRAYPYWIAKSPLLSFAFGNIPYFNRERIPDMPPDHPDHYRVSAAPRRTADPAAGEALLSALGLLKPIEPIKRRV